MPVLNQAIASFMCMIPNPCFFDFRASQWHTLHQRWACYHLILCQLLPSALKISISQTQFRNFFREVCLSCFVLQVLLGRPCKASSDIYSFGVIMWEICVGSIPERGRMGPIR